MKTKALRILAVFAGLVAAALTLHVIVNWLGAADLIRKLHGH